MFTQLKRVSLVLVLGATTTAITASSSPALAMENRIDGIGREIYVDQNGMEYVDPNIQMATHKKSFTAKAADQVDADRHNQKPAVAMAADGNTKQNGSITKDH